MNLHCPQCGVKGSADDSYSGRRIKCPKCNTVFELVHDLAGDASSVLSSTSISLHCPECGVSGSADASYNGKSVRCPKCAAIFTTGSVLDAEERVETAAGESDAPIETVVAPVATDIAEEAVIADGGAANAVARERGESVEPAALTEQDVVLDAVDPEPEFEAPPVDVDETTDIKAPEPPPEGEEIEIAVEDGDAPVEIEEKVAAAAEDDEQFVPEREEAVFLAGEEEFPKSHTPLPAADSSGPEAAPIEQAPYGVDAEECWQCGTKDNSGQPFATKDGRMYCSDCVSVEELAVSGPPVEEPAAAVDFAGQDTGPEDVAVEGQTVPYYNFTIGEALGEAWAHTRGAKGTIWKGSVLMYLVIMVVFAVGAYVLPSQAPGTPEATGLIGGAIFQAVGDAVSVLFTAGLLFMGIRRVAGDQIEWRMVFRGFSCAGKIIVATILQSILISVGILLLVLPGIYLAVGYAMALPLIVDRGMSPWEAMETSRKAIHKIWWKTAGLLLVMGLITIASMIPLGIGLIWTWPMFIVLAGVLYRYLFGTVKGDE